MTREIYIGTLLKLSMDDLKRACISREVLNSDYVYVFLTNLNMDLEGILKDTDNISNIPNSQPLHDIELNYEIEQKRVYLDSLTLNLMFSKGYMDPFENNMCILETAKVDDKIYAYLLDIAKSNSSEKRKKTYDFVKKIPIAHPEQEFPWSDCL